jgi:hypothetical protein
VAAGRAALVATQQWYLLILALLKPLLALLKPCEHSTLQSVTPRGDAGA